jgi:hypothetical protein
MSTSRAAARIPARLLRDRTLGAISIRRASSARFMVRAVNGWAWLSMGFVLGVR